MSTAVARSLPTLYEVEENLLGLLDSEALVTEEQQEEYQRDLAIALQKSVDKRQRVGEFILYTRSMQENCEREIERLTNLKHTFQTAEERACAYVQNVLESLSRDSKGKPPKLTGHTLTLCLRGLPPSVEFTDEDAIPDRYRSITVTLPMDLWKNVIATEDHDDSDPIWAEFKAAGLVGKVSISKKAIKQAIESGADVEGADLSIGGYKLEVK